MSIVLAALLIMLGFVWGMVFQEALDTYRVLKDSYNYKLFRFLFNKSGIILGINQHGRIWIELRQSGKTLRSLQIVRGEVV
jgi:hypothetical protein